MDIEKFFEKHNWLLGESTVKRAFAIYGYTMLAVLCMYGAILGIWLVASIPFFFL